MSAVLSESAASDERVADLDIEGFAPAGDGVGHIQGAAVFVPGAIEGERVRVAIPAGPVRAPTQGRLLDILSRSPDRLPPACPHAGVCGGCQWLHVAPRRQRTTKAAMFAQALGQLLDGVETRPLAHASQDLRYRARATLHVSGGRLGFSQKRSHAVVAVNTCPLLDDKLSAALTTLQTLLAEKSESWRLPRGCVDVALACDASRVSAAFFLERLSDDAERRLSRLARHAALDGALAVVNGRVTPLFGKPVLQRRAPSSTSAILRTRPDLFAQAHPQANALLVSEVVERLAGAERVLELHGGSGNFTLALAERVKALVSIEMCAGALELARQSAREASFGHVRFIVGDAIRQARDLARSGMRFDALLLDPPRGGAPGIAAVAEALDVHRVVYVSCNPVTLARDAQSLVATGYQPTFARPFDMFPQTVHLEGVMVFERERRPPHPRPSAP